jgi:uncharacterized membrane protein
MHKKQLTSKSNREKSRTWFDSHEFWTSAAWSLISIALALLGLLTPVYNASESRWLYPGIHSLKLLSYFAGGIILLAFIVVSIASFMRRKNRGAILLKRRLSEIYLSAMRSSAFNPQLRSPTTDD